MKSKQLKTKPTIFKSDILTFLLIGFGVVIFLITSILFYLSSHFDKYHTPKVNALNSVKFEITSAYIDHREVSQKDISTDLTSLTNAKNRIKELSQDKHWLFSSISICSAEQQEQINVILKQFQLFEKLLVAQDYTAASKQEYTVVFNSLLNNIDNLQTGLDDRYILQKNFIYFSEILIIIALLLYLLSIFFIATKRNMVREKLLLEAQKSNYFLKEAQQMAKLIVYSYDFKTKHWEASESFSNIVGAEVTENRMQSWIDRIHPKDRLRLTNLFEQRTQDSTTKFNETYRVVNANTGETHWVHHVIQDIKKDKNGNLLPVNGLIQDITQHKLAEEKIKRSNVILNKLNSLVLVINREGEVTYVSKGIKNILGYKPKDILGQGWWQQTFPDAESAQRSKESVYEYFNEKLSFVPNEEFSLRHIKTKNGESKWINWSFTRESENSFIAIGLDITESYEKTKQFTTLTEIAHDAIILTDDIGNIIVVNQSARQMFGYSKNEILGKPAIVLMPKKHKDSFIHQLNKANKEGDAKKSKFRIGEGITKKGVVFPIEISFNSWINNNKQIHCAFIKDITQQKYEEKIKEIIYNITKYAQENPKLDALLPFIKKSLSSVIDTTTFFVSLYDDDKENFNSYEKMDPKNGKSFVNFPKGGSLFDQVVETKKSLLYTKPSKINGTEIKSKCWIGVPLTVKQNVIGVMSIRSYTDKNAFTQKDVSLLELVASTISQVIQKTKDFEKINLLNQALVQSSAIILITNTKGEIEYVNPSFTKITGYQPKEILGKNPSFIGVKNRNKRASINLWKTIVNGKSWKGELTNIKKNGTQYTVMATIAPVKNNTEEVTHYIAVQEDITKKRKLEHQFINGFIEAQEIERQSFGEELHDGISQILSAETMYINVLIKENQDRINGKAKFLTKIRELNLSAANEARNIAHGLMSDKLMKTGLIKAIENICLDYTNTKNIQFLYVHKNISEKELSKELKINIFRIIQEITTNIVRHSRATETTITFVKLKQGVLNLVIKDNGIGIDYDKTKGNPKGVGFENIKRRVTLLSGTLDIDTSANNGLCYTINIPL